MRAIASSPTRLCRKPPPTTMRSVSAQALVLRNRPRHIGQFLGEFLDRAMHQRCGVDIVADQRRVESFLAISSGGFLPKRIVAVFLQRFAQAVENLAERALAGAVAEKAVLVLQFDVEAVDLDRRQPGGAVAGDARGR